jgi:hypothetical protein
LGAVAGLVLVLVMVGSSRIAGKRMGQPFNALSPQGSEFQDAMVREAESQATRNKSIAPSRGR